MHALAGLCLCLVATSCQGMDGQAPLEAAPTALPAPAGDEVLGKGPVKVALIVARGAAGQAGIDAAEYRNGAALAISDLGSDHITLSVLGSGGDAAAARASARQSIGDGALLIIGPASAAELEAVAAESRRSKTPVLAFADNTARRAAGVFTLRSDEIDGALAVGAYAAAAGKGDILAIAGPGGLSGNAPAQLKAGLEKSGGRLLGIAEFSEAGGISGAGDLIGKAQAVIVFLAADPEQAVTALRAGGLAADAPILGTNLWTRQHYASAALVGALVPAPEQSGLREIEGRMRAAYGRPMTMEAAYAYDAVALAAGVVRALGADGLKAAVLYQPVGFRGGTGAFRFGEDGTVTRLYGVYQIGRDGLKLAHPAAQGF